MKTILSISLVAVLLLTTAAASAQTTKYRRPFQGNHDVTAYFDTDGVRGNGSDQDYQCNSFAYDGHGGTDYGMPVGSTVVAAAEGVVTRTNNSCPDYGSLGNTCGGSLGNWVELRHPDGSMTMYAHMKRNSLQVSPGQEVECGQALGQSASSGSSTGPHLHFGSRAGSAGNWSITSTRGPYQGPCGRNDTLWVNQGAYRGLPGTTCQTTMPDVYDIDLWIEPTGIEDQLVQGTSFEQPDALPGDVFEVSIYVHNKTGVPIRGVELGYTLGPQVEALDYVIESDVSGGGEFGVNDADAHEGNPPKDAMGAEGALTMYAFADGETKRVRITVTALEPVTAGEAAARGWLRNVDDVYVQPNFGEEPSLSKADEPLQAALRVDVLATSGWSFDSDEAEMLEGWDACGGGEAYVDPMQGGAVLAGGTQCLTSPAWTQIDAGAVNHLVLDVVSTPAPRAAALFWTTAETGELGAEPSLEFEIPADTESVSVPLYTASTWSGVIRRLQLNTAWGEAPATESVIRAVQFHFEEPVDDPMVPTDPTDPGDDSTPVTPDPDDPGVGGDGKQEEPNQSEGGRVIEARGGCSTSGTSGAPAAGLLAMLWLLLGAPRTRRLR